MTRQWLVAKMGDMREILAEVNAALDQNRPCVYCAVVETRGSTPQKAGAAMLVFADGSQRGTLGGGCVEAEVKQRALALLSAGNRPEMLTFSLDDNYGWDDGLICGGRMTMLVDPLSDGPGSEGEGSGVRGRGSGVRGQRLLPAVSGIGGERAGVHRGRGRQGGGGAGLDGGRQPLSP